MSELIKLLKSPLENETMPLVLAHVVKDLSTLTFKLVLKVHVSSSVKMLSIFFMDIPYRTGLGSDATWVCRVSTLCVC